MVGSASVASCFLWPFDFLPLDSSGEGNANKSGLYRYMARKPA